MSNGRKTLEKKLIFFVLVQKQLAVTAKRCIYRAFQTSVAKKNFDTFFVPSQFHFKDCHYTEL
jgi:hypothetical protein